MARLAAGIAFALPAIDANRCFVLPNGRRKIVIVERANPLGVADGALNEPVI